MQRLLLAVLITAAVIATTCAETTCQSHKRNAQTSDHGMRWNIQCDANGKYLPLQCTDEPQEKKRWCTCYNEEDAITSPSRKMRHCQCPLAKKQAETSNGSPCVPQCAQNGQYVAKQCCPTTRKCHCVNPTTGEKTTEPTNDANLTCP